VNRGEVACIIVVYDSVTFSRLIDAFDDILVLLQSLAQSE
jgi:hypothetical protein